MKKPTEKQFWAAYIFVFLLMQIFVATSVPEKEFLHGVIAVNVAFTLLNLLGVSLAGLSWTPWRDQ